MSGEIEKTIELDCPPGGTRPWHLIEQVVEGTPIVLTPADTEPGSTFFGHRTWSFPDVDDKVWIEKVQPVTSARIADLFNAGVIRFGSW